MRRIAASEVHRRLGGNDEIALLDVREQGVHYKGHPFFASSAPLSRLELMIRDLVPRRAAPIVLFDDADGLAEIAAARLAAWGYRDVAILDGGLAAWRAAGYEVFSGINVPSKAFGEFVEHRYGTPRMPAAELKALKDKGVPLVILDSRPFEEYRRMNIPGGIDAPGAELAFRVHDQVPDPETLVVVNCAGRTRSIIGAQSLINAGIPNKVVALKDGTMGWELAGFACEHGAQRRAPPPSREGARKGKAAAARVAKRFGVRFAARAKVQAWLRDPTRTTYFLDVRSPEEYRAGHIAGARHAPGGQLVQATDEYCAVRNARIVLCDPDRVRAVMTASWLIQMNWPEVYVLTPEGHDGFSGWPVARGEYRGAVAGGLAPWAAMTPLQWYERMRGQSDCAAIDFASSLRHRARHVPHAWWAVRARLNEARKFVFNPRALLLTSEDGLVAGLAAPEAAALWPKADIFLLAGGNAAWFAAGLPTEQGLDRATTTPDDVWYKPYDHPGEVLKRHMQDYLDWEVALVDQIKRDPTIRFKAFD